MKKLASILVLVACGRPTTTTTAAPASSSAPGVASAATVPTSVPAPGAAEPPPSVDLSFFTPEDGLEVLANGPERIVALVRPKLRSIERDPAAYAALALSGAAEHGLVIEKGCVTEAVHVPSVHGHLYGLMAARDAKAIEEESARETAADLAHAFAKTPQRVLGARYAWTGGLALLQGDMGGPAAVLVVRGHEVRKFPVHAKYLDGVVLAGGSGYVGLGPVADAKGTVSRLDLATGALVDLKLARVAALAPIGEEALLVLRHEPAKRRMCLDRVAAAITPVGCVVGSPSRVARLRVAANGAHASFVTDEGNTYRTHVLEVATGKVVQSGDFDEVVAIGPSGELAVQDRAGPSTAIKIARGGTMTAVAAAHGVLAGFDAAGNVVSIDDEALHAGKTCSVVQLTSPR